MLWKVIYKGGVGKDLEKIPTHFRLRIFRAVERLKIDPFLGKQLEVELRGMYSFRVWPYRIIYKILKEEIVIVIVHIGHRQGAYN